MVGRIFQGLENGLSLSYAFATMSSNPAFATDLSPGRHTDRGEDVRGILPSGAQLEGLFCDIPIP